MKQSFLIILIILIAGLSYLYFEKDGNYKPTPSVSTTNALSPTPFPPIIIPSNSEDWKTLLIPELSILLKYPPFFRTANFGVLIDYRNREDQPYQGALMGRRMGGGIVMDDTFSVVLNAVSGDFAAPREATIGDTYGYVKEGTAYYYKTASGKKSGKIPYPVTEFKTVDGEGILLRGINQESAPGVISENMRMAIINLSSREFPALGIVHFDSLRLSDADFIKILQTIDFQR